MNTKIYYRCGSLSRYLDAQVFSTHKKSRKMRLKGEMELNLKPKYSAGALHDSNFVFFQQNNDICYFKSLFIVVVPKNCRLFYVFKLNELLIKTFILPSKHES